MLRSLSFLGLLGLFGCFSWSGHRGSLGLFGSPRSLGLLGLLSSLGLLGQLSLLGLSGKSRPSRTNDVYFVGSAFLDKPIYKGYYLINGKMIWRTLWVFMRLVQPKPKLQLP